MITAYNLVNKQLTAVEHSFMLKPSSDWIVNPIIPDRHALDSTPTEFWVYESESTILRVMTAEERDTDPGRVERAKKQKIAEISALCEAEITDGFFSSALGDPHWYDCSAYDQLNLMSSLSITAPTVEYPDGTSTFYACRLPREEAKEYVVHTHSQLKQVAADQARNRLTHLQRFSSTRLEVMNLTRVSEIQAVEWEVS